MMVKAKTTPISLEYERFICVIEKDKDGKSYNIIARNEDFSCIMGRYCNGYSDNAYSIAWNKFMDMLKAYNKKKRIYEL